MGSLSNTLGQDYRLDFGRFSLLPYQRLLLRDQVPVRLGARAFDILVALVKRPGELVSKDELTAQVWPNTSVDPSGLRVHMTALRKALGDSDARLIRTDPGRGYRFTAPLVQAAETSAVPPAVIPSVSTLPVAVTRLIGRSKFVQELATRLPSRQLITIVGPGGIGKTRVALACAQRLAGSYRDGVHFVDLAKVEEQEPIVSALTAVLGIAGGANPLRQVIDHVRNRAMLLVIDNCEHVIDAAAELVEAICTAADGVHILATSREALRVLGECVTVLPPLPSPPEEATDISAAAALSYPAVELFVERAAAARFGYALSDAEAPIVADICRRLDGVALAIELAAAQVDTFGVTWLAEHLNERLWLLRHGRRTAVPRHQNLVALLDWSYRLLSAQEQATLQRVAVFPGAFTLAEAIGMASGEGIGDSDVVGAVCGLVAKSLAAVDSGGSVTRYRLAETTRTYASAIFAGRNEIRAACA